MTIPVLRLLRQLWLLWLLLLLLPGVSAGASFYTIPGTDTTLIYVVTDGAAIIGISGGTGGEFVIPPTIAGRPVTEIRNLGFLPQDCRKVVIPDTVHTIGPRAFSDCRFLQEITLPSGLKVIGSGAFQNCRSITSLVIPQGVTTIGSSAFSLCLALRSIVLPDSLTRIDHLAFDRCGSLESVVLPPGLTAIANGTFSHCSALASVSFGEGVETIGKSAFFGCSALTTVTLPGGLTSLGTLAFDSCPLLTSIHISEENGSFRSHEGILYDSTYTRLLRYPEGRSGRFSIPAGVREIGEGAFNGCTHLTAVTLPGTVTDIHAPAFRGCTRLSEIDVSAGNVSYRTRAGVLYDHSHALLIRCPEGPSGHFVIPGDVHEIAPGAFSDRASLTGVTFSERITAIPDYAFARCTGLTHITLSGHITSIGEYSFNRCSNLTGITLSEGLRTIGIYAFGRCTSLTSLALPASLTGFDEPYNILIDTPALTRIDVAAGGTAFSSYDGLLYNSDGTELLLCPQGRSHHVDIPHTVTAIAFRAFSDCPALGSISLPPGIATIAVDAFYGTTSLRSITFTGDPPAEYDPPYSLREVIIYHPAGAAGFTSPFWKRSRTVALPTPDADLDGDGWGHRLESLLGTDPGDPASHLRTRITLAGGVLRLHLDRHSDRCEFTVRTAGRDLADPAAWRTLDGIAFTVTPGVTPGGVTATLPLDPAAGPAFFRVHVREK